MHRIDLDQAIVELDDLLELAEPGSEDQFQEWAERNSDAIFHVLGYRRAIPHPRLLKPGGGVFIPDFLAQDNNGLWEVVELKTAEPAIYKERERRSDFYESIHQCISQCREYSEWLGHEPARRMFETKYQTQLARHPSILMVAGSATDYNRQEVATNLSGRTPAMRLFTWGDVLNMLNGFRSAQFGETHGASGCTVMLSVLLHQGGTQSPSTLLDVGERLDRDRVQLIVSGHRLRLRIFESDGEVNTFAAGGVLPFDVPTLIVVEIANLATSVRISVEINRSHGAEQSIAAGRFQLRKGYFPVVVGADAQGSSSSAFTLAGSLLSAGPMLPKEAWAIQRFLWRKAGTPGEPALRFDGNGQFLYAEGHPNLDPDGKVSNKLVQPLAARGPTIVAVA